MRSVTVFGTSSETTSRVSAKPKNGVAEAFEPRDFATAVAEAVHEFLVLLQAGAAQHERFICEAGARDKILAKGKVR